MLASRIRSAVRPPQHHLRLPLFRFSSTTSQSSPPPARPYRAQTPSERAALRKPDPEPDLPTPKPRSRTRELLSKYLNPFHEPTTAAPTSTTAPEEEARPADPERGLAAARRVVSEGVLDPKYKAASRRWIAIIIGLVVAIGLTPEVWRRTMAGEKRKEVPRPKSRENAEKNSEVMEKKEA